MTKTRFLEIVGGIRGYIIDGVGIGDGAHADVILKMHRIDGPPQTRHLIRCRTYANANHIAAKMNWWLEEAGKI